MPVSFKVLKIGSIIGQQRGRIMHRLILTIVAASLAAGSASAAVVERKIAYEINGKGFEGMLVYDDSINAKRPAILMEPDWSGVSAGAIEIARHVAGKDYVVFVTDMFGTGYAPEDAKERIEAAKVRWRVVLFGGTVHAFTDKSAPVPGFSATATRYDPVVAKRAPIPDQ
jgi:dienelactone hydrolase